MSGNASICKDTYYNYGSYLRSRGCDKKVCDLAQYIESGDLNIGPIDPGTCNEPTRINSSVQILACNDVNESENALVVSGGGLQVNNNATILGVIDQKATNGGENKFNTNVHIRGDLIVTGEVQNQNSTAVDIDESLRIDTNPNYNGNSFQIFRSKSATGNSMQLWTGNESTSNPLDWEKDLAISVDGTKNVNGSSDQQGHLRILKGASVCNPPKLNESIDISLNTKIRSEKIALDVYGHLYVNPGNNGANALLDVDGEIQSNSLIIEDGSANTFYIEKLTAGTIDCSDINLTDLDIDYLTVSKKATITDLDATNITTQTLDIEGTFTADSIITKDVSANDINVGDLSANNINFKENLTGNDISADSLSVIDISGTTLTIEKITASGLIAGADISSNKIISNDCSLNTIQSNLIDTLKLDADAITISPSVGAGAIITLNTEGIICDKQISGNSLKIGGSSTKPNCEITNDGSIVGNQLNIATIKSNKLDTSSLHVGKNITINGSDNSINGCSSIITKDLTVNNGQINIGNNTIGQDSIEAKEITVKQDLTVNGNLNSKDISANSLIVQEDISANSLIVQDISANGVVDVQDISANSLHVQQDISANSLHVQDISANSITIVNPNSTLAPALNNFSQYRSLLNLSRESSTNGKLYLDSSQGFFTNYPTQTFKTGKTADLITLGNAFKNCIMEFTITCVINVPQFNEGVNCHFQQGNQKVFDIGSSISTLNGKEHSITLGPMSYYTTNENGFNTNNNFVNTSKPINIYITSIEQNSEDDNNDNVESRQMRTCDNQSRNAQVREIFRGANANGNGNVNGPTSNGITIKNIVLNLTTTYLN